MHVFQKPEISKKYVFLAKCIENSVQREKYSTRNKEQKRWRLEASNDSYTFQAFEWTRIQVFHDNNSAPISFMDLFTLYHTRNWLFLRNFHTTFENYGWEIVTHRWSSWHSYFFV